MLKKRTIIAFILGIGVLLAGTPDVFALYYYGGNGDGFSVGISATSNLFSISSTAVQEFSAGDAATVINSITIEQESAESGINTTSDIRIKIPAALDMIWDTSDTSAVITGSSGKVSSTVSYEDSGKTLVINVTANFANGDSISISGLSFKDFRACLESCGGLKLSVDGGSTIAATDSLIKTIKSAFTFGGGGGGDGAAFRTMAVVVGTPALDGAIYVKLPVDNEDLVKEDGQYAGMYFFMTSGTNINKCYLIVNSDERTVASDGTDTDTITLYVSSTAGFSAGDSFVIVDRVYNKKSYASANFNLTKSGALNNQWITWTNSGLPVVDAENEKAYNVNADTGLNYVRLSKNIKLINSVTSSLSGVPISSQDSSFYMWGDSDRPFWIYASSSYVHSTKLLSLVFSETMAFSETLLSGSVQLGDDASGTNNITLASGEITASQSDSSTLTFTLSDAHRDAVSAWNGAGKTTLYIKVTTPGFKDLTGNSIATTTWCALGTWTKDTTAPTLSSWALNMQLKQLTMNFDENMDVSTLNIGQVTIQDTASGPATSYTLTNSTTSSSDGTNIVVNLSLTDFNKLVDDTVLASSQGTSWLVMPSTAIKDMSGNGVNAIVNTSAQQVANGAYTANTVTATHFKTAADETGTMTATLQAGAVAGQAVVIKAYDSFGYRAPAYTGAKTLTFSGANACPDGTNFPQAQNNASVWKRFVTEDTALTFSNGRATSTVKLYCREVASIVATEYDGATPLVVTDSADALQVTVTPKSAVKLAFSSPPSSAGFINVALTDQPAVAIRDMYGNKTNDTFAVTLSASLYNVDDVDAPGNLLATVNPVIASAGEAVFSGVTYNAATNNVAVYPDQGIYLCAKIAAGGYTKAYSGKITFSTANTTTVIAADSPVTSASFDPISYDSSSELLEVLKFKIKDITGDLTPTLVDQIQVPIGGTCGVAATNVAGARLNMEPLGVNLVVNGGFGSDTGWTKDTGTTISGGVATMTGYSYLAQDISDTNGWVVKIQYTVTANTLVSNFNLSSSGNTGLIPISKTVGAHTVYAVITNSSNLLRFTPSSGETGAISIDNVSVKQITVTSSPVLGANLVTNGDFGSWSGDNPVGWSVNESAGNIVTANSLQCRIVSDGTAVSVYEDILTIGKLYKISLNVTNVTSGSIKLQDNVSGDFGGSYYYNTTGVRTFYWVARGSRFIIARGAACDVTFDDVSIQEVTSFSSPIATVTTGAAITDSLITFGSTPNSDNTAALYSVAEGTEPEFSVSLYLKNERLRVAGDSSLTYSADHLAYTFDIDESNIGVDGGTSSQMSLSAPKSVTPVTKTVVIANTYLEVVDQATGGSSITLPANTNVELQARATDANHNIDRDYDTTDVHYLRFSGLTFYDGAPPTQKPRIIIGGNTYYMGDTIPVSFSTIAGVSNAGTLPLIAFKAETKDLTVAEYVDNVNRGLPVYPLNIAVVGTVASTITRVTGHDQTAAVNRQLPIPLKVVVKDAYGNLVANKKVTFTISAPVNGAKLTFAGAITLDVDTNSSGEAQTDFWLGSQQADYTITANYSGGSGASFTEHAVVPALISYVSGDNQTNAVTLNLGSLLIVKLVGTGSVPIPGESVLFMIVEIPDDAVGQQLTGEGTTYTATTGDDGSASVTLKLGDKITTALKKYKVRASYPANESITPYDFTATATAGVADHIVLTAATSSPQVDALTAFTVTVKDIHDNTRTAWTADGTASTFKLESSHGRVGVDAGTGAFYSDAPGTTLLPIVNGYPQLSIAADAQTAVFYYVDTQTGSAAVTATRTGGMVLVPPKDTSSTSVTLTPGNLDHFTVTGGAGVDYTISPAAFRTITVKAYDSHNNLVSVMPDTNIVFSTVVSGDDVSPSPTSEKATCTNSSSANKNFGLDTLLHFVSGTAETNLKIYRATLQDAQVSIVATASGKTTPVPLSFKVLHGAPDHLKFSGNIPIPAGGFKAGVEFTLPSLRALDAYSNLCSAANGAAAYAGSKALVFSLGTGTANSPDGLYLDAYKSDGVLDGAVIFAGGVSTNTLAATLYRAQPASVVANADDLDGTDVASNTVTVAPQGVNKLSFYVQPSTSALTNAVLARQPQVAVADSYGNPVTATSGQITLRASMSNTAFALPAAGHTLSGDSLVVTTTSGVAVFSGLKYNYPESIYLQATADVAGVSAVYSYQINVTTAADDGALVASSDLTEPATISSVACAKLVKVQVFDFKATDAGKDGYATSIKQIVITRNTSTDTTGGWSAYISGASISNGTASQDQDASVTDNALTFGANSEEIFSVPDGGYKTFTLSIYFKTNLPAGADGKIIGFDIDPNDDISVNAVGSGFAPAGSMTSSTILDVIITKFMVSGTATTMVAGNQVTISLKATDVNGNIDWGYTGSRSIIFKGASDAISGEKPKCTEFSGAWKDFETSTLISFLNGQNNVAITMVLYKVEGATIKATSGANSSITTSASDDYEILVTGGAAAKLTWYTQPKTTCVANAPWSPFSVNVADAYDNVCSGSVTVTVAPTGGTASALSANSTVTQSGIATFNNFRAYCASYPGSVTLTASAGGLASSNASSVVTVVEKYVVTMRALDSVNGSALTSVTLKVLDAATGAVVSLGSQTNPIVGNSPFSFYVPYGAYQFNFNKEAYVETTEEKTADVLADSADAAYDNAITWTTYIMSISESLADYKVQSNFVYDETDDQLGIILRLEKRGQVIISSAINALGRATIDIYDGANNKLGTLTSTSFDANGNYWFDVTHATAQMPAGFTKAFVAGATYYARVSISYGGSAGDKMTYYAGNTFTITVTQSLKTITTQIAGLSTDIATQVTGVKTTVASQEEITREKIAAVKAETANLVTATGTTLPSLISTAKSDITGKVTTATDEIQTKLTTAAKSEILTRDSVVMLGSTIKIRYRTYPSVSPIITVYDPNNAIRVNAALMTEVTPGIYEYPLAFVSGWPRGDYSIICTESKYGTLDAITISAKSSDIENLAGNVSSIMGSVSNVKDIESKVAAFSSAFSAVEENIEKAAAAMAGIETGSKEAADAAAQLSTLYNSLKEMSAKIQQMGGTVGYDLQKLYEVNESKAQDIGYIRNKTQELKAMMSLNQQMIENAAKEEPVVQTWFEFR